MNNSNFNPRINNLRKRLVGKYSTLQAQNRTDETIWTGAGVFLLHCLIAFGTCSIIKNFDMSKMEGIVMSILALLLSVVVEFLKSRYQERFLIYDLILKDEESKEEGKVNEEQVNLAYAEKQFNGKILAVIYVISAIFFITNGIMYAKKINPPVTLNKYDLSLKVDYDQKIKNVQYAQERGYKVAKVKELQSDADASLEKLNRHKAIIDGQNLVLSSEQDTTTMIYVIIAIALCVLLEAALFYLRQLHETKQYKIALSIGGIETKTNSTGSTVSNSKSIDYAKEIEKLKAKIEEFRDTLETKDATIQFYKDKNNLLMAESKLNGKEHSKS